MTRDIVFGSIVVVLSVCIAVCICGFFKTLSESNAGNAWCIGQGGLRISSGSSSVICVRGGDILIPPADMDGLWSPW
jgi:hypothetical protein